MFAGCIAFDHLLLPTFFIRCMGLDVTTSIFHQVSLPKGALLMSALALLMFDPGVHEKTSHSK